MWKKLLEQLKGSLKGERGVRLVVILGVAGLALILLSGFLPEKEKQAAESMAADASASDVSADLQEYCHTLEERLVTILGQVDGVGHCQVMLTATGTAETVYAQDEEEDQADSRTQSQRKCVIVSDSEGERPLVQQIVSPEISGVIVVCSGASSSVVQERVTNAVQAVLDIPASRICVVPTQK